MSETTLGRKEKRREQIKLQTRMEILQACAQLIVEKGVTGISMDDVATLSGLSKGSLYNYFSNRDELIWLVIDTYLQHFVDQVRTELHEGSEPWPQRFARLLDISLHLLESQNALPGVLDFFEEQLSKARYATSASRDVRAPMLRYVEQFHHQFEHFFSEGIEQGFIRGGHPLDTAFLFVNMVFHSFQYSKLGLLQSTPQQQRDQILQLFLIQPSLADLHV